MPTLAVQSAATPRSGAEELCKKLSSTVAGTLGKPESYVMVTFQKVDAMCYGGSADPAAFLYLSSLGSIDPDTNKATSAAVADVLEAELSVPKGRYCTYLCRNQNFTAFVLNRRVDLHAIDATLLDGVAMSVPHHSTEPARPRHGREMTS